MSIAGYMMITLFLFAAAVQYNDPDPLLWMTVYGTAAVVTWLFIRGSIHWGVPAILILPIVCGALYLGFRVTAMPSFAELAGSMAMKTADVELVREIAGLLIVGIWFSILSLSEVLEKR